MAILLGAEPPAEFIEAISGLRFPARDKMELNKFVSQILHVQAFPILKSKMLAVMSADRMANEIIV